MLGQEKKSGITVFAQTNFRNRIRKFGILKDDRRRHMYIIGKTGMGKTTLIENMIISDIYAGNGIAIVDPHGDSAEVIVEHVPSHRVNDVIYFNPSDTDYPIGFNILEEINPEYRHLVANGLVGVFKKIWADSWGPRLEYILMNTILALIEYPGSTLLGVLRMLVDKNYRKKIVTAVKDPMVRSFWENEYANYNDKFRSEAIAPIQNKVGQFLSSSIIRNIVGQPKSTINLREIMDSRKILIMNLSKGRIGEENSALLGAMMITRIQLAAMSRANIPEEDRIDFYLYVDEFQNFATESFADILSEARKYRLNLIMAHQYIEQLDENVAAAVFGNVGTMITFRVGAADAESLVKEFEPVFTEQHLVNITKFQIILKLMINGMSSQPFSAVTIPPLHSPTGNGEKIVQISRERFSRPKEIVEERILRWSGLEPESSTGTSSAPASTTSSAPTQDSRRAPARSNSRPTRAENRPRVTTQGQGEISLKEAIKRDNTDRGDRRPSRGSSSDGSGGGGGNRRRRGGGNNRNRPRPSSTPDRNRSTRPQRNTLQAAPPSQTNTAKSAEKPADSNESPQKPLTKGQKVRFDS